MVRTLATVSGGIHRNSETGTPLINVAGSGVGLGVAVGVAVGTAVAVAVGDGVADDVGDGVMVSVGVRVAVGDGLTAGVGGSATAVAAGAAERPAVVAETVGRAQPVSRMADRARRTSKRRIMGGMISGCGAAVRDEDAQGIEND
jgi:hypothetical protein